MTARRNERKEGLWPWIASRLYRFRQPKGSGAAVFSLLVFVGTLVASTTHAVEQKAFEEYRSADGRIRMIAFRYPMNLMERINQSVVYYVTRSNEGDLLLRFHASNARPEDKGLYGEYSISREKVLHVAELYGENREFTPDVVRRIEAYATQKDVVQLEAFGNSDIYPHLEDYADVKKEYLIDLDYGGSYDCDPFIRQCNSIRLNLAAYLFV